MTSYINKIPGYQCKDKMVNYIWSCGQVIYCNPPLLSSECKCPRCGQIGNGSTCLENSGRGWFCNNLDCVNHHLSFEKTQAVTAKRAMDWVVFCNQYNIGNLFHNIKFEDLTKFHSSERIELIREFAFRPYSLGVLHGDPGTGKTYIAFSVLELYLRYRNSAVYYESEMLKFAWLDSSKSADLTLRLRDTELLVIDDFAQGDLSPGYAAFVFSVINYRMGFDNKGTILTTNASVDKLEKYTGGAFLDRLRTARLNIRFKGLSLREKIA